MAAERRPRGTGKRLVAAHLQIEPEHYDKIGDLAATLRISKGRALDLILAAADTEQIKQAQHQEELDYPQAG